MSEYIDVEKLHAVLEGKLVGRGSGQSFARLVQMVQSVEFLPNGKVIHISADQQSARNYAADFKTILNYLGMGDLLTRITVGQFKFENGCSARFLSASSPQQLVTSLTGVRIDNYFVDHFAEYLITNEMHNFIQSRLT